VFVVQNRKLAYFLLLLIICSITIIAPRKTEAQTEYSIEIQGYTWDKSTISICVLPQKNMSWWKPAYLDAALHGIAQWNNAIQEFASNNTDYSYLSSVQFVPSIKYENVSGFDVYMGWIAHCSSDSTIGKTQAAIESPCVVINATVCLTAKAPSGHVMTETDMQNIVVHELGHTLGLSHCNYTSDVMYPSVYYTETVKPLSSLNLYAVSQVFEWLKTQDTSSITCPSGSVVTMPQNMSYGQFQIATANLPGSPMNIAEYFLQPEKLVTIAFALVLIVTTALLFRKKKPDKSE
jgi:predicted Zn-dependent protease